MKRKILFILMSIITAGLNFSEPIHASDATVIPKGRFMVSLESQFYLPIDEWYNNDGNTEPLANDFNTNLNGSVFPQLSLIEQAFGMPSGSATLGDSIVSYELNNTIQFDFYIFYGLTDRLSIGAKIPYWTTDTDVEARVDNSSATVVPNPFLGTPSDPFQGAALVPRALVPEPLQQPLTTDDVQNLLVSEFGYERLESWSHSGLSDIEFGGRYQYYSSDSWRLAFLGAIRAPTGRTDDPDNLADRAFGRGCWAFLFHFNNDFIKWKNIELNGTFKYELNLPHTQTMRVPTDVNQPITSNKEELDIKWGDVIKLEAEGRYNLSPSWLISLFYRYGHAFKADVDGDLGLAYDQIEAESDSTSHEYRVGIAYLMTIRISEPAYPAVVQSVISLPSYPA